MSDDQSTPPSRGLRAAVDADALAPDNELHYLVLLAIEARRYDGAWNGDPEAAARWAVAQWCQETGFVPNLRGVDVGEMVPKDDLPEALPTAFDEPATTTEPQTDGRDS